MRLFFINLPFSISQNYDTFGSAGVPKIKTWWRGEMLVVGYSSMTIVSNIYKQQKILEFSVLRVFCLTCFFFGKRDNVSVAGMVFP